MHKDENKLPGYKAQVKVTLKPGVLDPQGAAIERALRSMGNKGVESVRVGKIIDIKMRAESPEKAREKASAWADELLANVNTEAYEVEVGELK